MKRLPLSRFNRPRMREQREDRERGIEAVVPWVHVHLFTQFFAKDDGPAGYASRLPARSAGADKVMIEALTEQLALRVQGVTQWPLLAVLYLPRLGRINASVQRQPGAWNIELEAEEPRTADWLGTVKKRYQDRLAEALGQPVDIHIKSASAK
ncbi:type III secretion system HrpP C-terminal domain-containing protein [Pseudomonas sp. 1152_12]|uniref:type III secretion system HrpP C-terminal domain-containing protein n=1 Tax=Pseudomonas sp. 1152_12 TaxID=2604455 RepID=UPI004064C4D7